MCQTFRGVRSILRVKRVQPKQREASSEGGGRREDLLGCRHPAAVDEDRSALVRRRHRHNLQGAHEIGTTKAAEA